LNAILETLTARVSDILGSELVGAYLQGSFALGDWAEHSDVDFLFITKGELSENTLEALQAMHKEIYALPSTWAQHLEGSYFSRAALASSDMNTRLWYLDNGSQHLVQSTHCNTRVVRWTTREHGIALFGPDPKTLIPPVSSEALRAEVRDVMRDWRAEINERRFDSRWYQQFVVLSYARMLHTLETGSVHSKRAGALWAQANLEPRWGALIETAEQEQARQRDNYKRPADPEAVAQTLAFVQSALKLEPSLPRAQE
jgi:predicted nucleotidyltransferase